ncbi:DUF5682 family protein [Amorphoplanes digitatis]|uniref:DUF5682 family protein n=1 Tax=Actinoplanes digitatis TaxID=1868 RepID=UPI00360DB349
MPEQFYGIRHHGPGSARAVVQELNRQRPAMVLIEGPPEADDLVRWAADTGLEPPVALLGYAADDPARAAFWPFAVFSPEWQAIRWAVEHRVPVRFFDLPYSYRLTDDRTQDTPPTAGPRPATPSPTRRHGPDRHPHAAPAHQHTPSRPEHAPCRRPRRTCPERPRSGRDGRPGQRGSGRVGRLGGRRWAGAGDSRADGTR